MLHGLSPDVMSIRNGHNTFNVGFDVSDVRRDCCFGSESVASLTDVYIDSINSKCNYHLSLNIRHFTLYLQLSAAVVIY